MTLIGMISFAVIDNILANVLPKSSKTTKRLSGQELMWKQLLPVWKITSNVKIASLRNCLKPRYQVQTMNFRQSQTV